MQALILAAGFGTRLRPLTNDKPKALVEISGHTLLEINIKHLINAGVTRCVVNVHHFGDMVVQYVNDMAKSIQTVPLCVSDERSMILDTGGAIKHAATYFADKEPLLIHNVDVISDVDLKTLEQHHLTNGNLATLCVCRRDSRRKLLFDKSGNLIGRDDGKLHNGCESLAFSGIALVDSRLASLLPNDDHPYPIIDEYIKLAKGYRIGYFLHDADHWIDLGTIEHLNYANSIFGHESLEAFIKTNVFP